MKNRTSKAEASELFVQAMATLKFNEEYSCTEIAHIFKMYDGMCVCPFPSDYSYNCTNDGIDFSLREHRLFEKVGKGKYRYLGAYYPYTGTVTHTNRQRQTTEVGAWVNGEYIPNVI